jgi:hypothetical protein
MNKLLEQAKELLKHLEENPKDLEQLSKAKPKMEKPSPVKGVHQPVEPKGGTSFSHQATKLGAKDLASKWAKQDHVKVLSEQKAMPKPNLPKSEIQKEELDKGVIDAAKKKGEDVKLKALNQKAQKEGKETIESRTNTAKKFNEALGPVFKEKLDKGVIDAAKKVAGKVVDAAKWVGHQTKEDIKTAGKMITDTKNIKTHAKDRLKTYFSEKNKKAEIMADIKKCGDMIEAKMKKEEMEKASSKLGEFHAKYPHNEKGTLPAVSEKRDIKDGKMVGHFQNPSIAGAHVRRGDVAGAKKIHKELIHRQKAMPKPNLPKAELDKTAMPAAPKPAQPKLDAPKPMPKPEVGAKI